MFLNYYLELLLLLLLPVLGFGLAICLCNRMFFSLIGRGKGMTVALVIHVVTTPIRELAHLLACVICFHRVHEFRLFNLYSPEGEIGFVEHSYHRRNPVAVLGNFVFAVAPVALGLFLTFVVVLTCFGESFRALSLDLKNLRGTEAGFGAYFKLGAGFFLSSFAGAKGLGFKILGMLLLLFICLGVYVSLTELYEGLSGALIFGGLMLGFAGITFLVCDERMRRLILSGIRSFSAVLFALFFLLLVCSLLMLAIAFVIFMWRSFLPAKHGGTGLPAVRQESDDWV